MPTFSRAHVPALVLVAAALACLAPAARADEAAAPATFSEHVAPILQKNCQSCHRPGEAAPMSLLDYAGARPWAKSIKKAVQERSMPPWHAHPDHGTFANDRRLSESDIATLVAWVDAGAPEGDPAKLPAPIDFVEGWQIGVPDLVLQMENPYTAPAEGILDYQHIKLPPFPADRWVKKVEIRPSNRNISHHTNLFVKMPGDDSKRSQRDFVTGYVPGGIAMELPDDYAVFFPKGMTSILQLHYVTVGREETDRTSVGFVFAREPVRKQVRNYLISNYFFKIPPGDPNYEVKAFWDVTQDVTLIGTMVHMHLRGKDYLYEAKYPDGREEILMSIPKYDFNWQIGYHFKDRPKLPAGTRVTGLAHMDNSPENPHNPDPTAEVRYGDQTFDEMIMGFVFYTHDDEDLRETTGAINLGPLTDEEKRAAGLDAAAVPAAVPAVSGAGN